MLDHVCRLALAAVFTLAGVSKVIDLDRFEDQLLLHSALPPALAPAVARVLPWLELVCGACLLVGIAVREAALLAGLLLAAFILYALLAPAPDACGCFVFPLPEPAAPWWLPLRDGLLLLASLRLVLKRREEG